MKKFIKYTAGVFLGCTMLTSFVCAKTFEESAAEMLGKIQTFESSQRGSMVTDSSHGNRETLRKDFLRLVGGLNPQHKYSGRKPTEAEKAIVATFAVFYCSEREVFSEIKREASRGKGSSSNIEAVQKASSAYEYVRWSQKIPSEHHTVFDDLLITHKDVFGKGKIPADVQKLINAQKEERMVGSAVSSSRSVDSSKDSTSKSSASGSYGKPMTQRGIRGETPSSGKPGGSISSFKDSADSNLSSSRKEDKKNPIKPIEPVTALKSEKRKSVPEAILGFEFILPEVSSENKSEVKIAAPADSTSSSLASSSSDSSSVILQDSASGMLYTEITAAGLSDPNAKTKKKQTFVIYAPDSMVGQETLKDIIKRLNREDAVAVEWGKDGKPLNYKQRRMIDKFQSSTTVISKIQDIAEGHNATLRESNASKNGKIILTIKPYSDYSSVSSTTTTTSSTLTDPVLPLINKEEEIKVPTDVIPSSLDAIILDDKKEIEEKVKKNPADLVEVKLIEKEEKAEKDLTPLVDPSSTSAKPKKLDYTKFETFKDNLILQKGARLSEKNGNVVYSFTVTPGKLGYYRYLVTAPKSEVGFSALKTLTDNLNEENKTKAEIFASVKTLGGKASSDADAAALLSMKIAEILKEKFSIKYRQWDIISKIIEGETKNLKSPPKGTGYEIFITGAK